jgi:protein AATF/BFR2
MWRLSETKVESSDLDSTQESRSLWKGIERNFKQSLPFIETTIDRWNERT